MTPSIPAPATGQGAKAPFLRPTLEGLWAAFARVAGPVFLCILPLALLTHVAVTSGGGFGFDFHVFWQAGRDFVSGTSPYPAHAVDVIAAKENFVYPVWVAAAFAPLGLLPYSVAVLLFSGVVLGSAALALCLLGIRDWRCYGAVFVAIPMLSSFYLGTLSPLLMLALAALWRYRDDRRVAVPTLAVLVAAKLFLWPLLVYFAATRRSKTALLACLAAVGVTALAWARLGFAGLVDYPGLLRLVVRVEERDSYSVTSLGAAVGLPRPLANIAALAAGTAVLAAAVAIARRTGAEREAFVVTLAAALFFSPIVWSHYLLLLFVPLALARPRFSPLWLCIVWMPPDNRHSTAVLILGMLATAILVAGCLRPARQTAPPVVSPGGAR
jgi:alpha-1,2-mannosyltransferase